MKKEVSPALTGVIAVVAILVLGFIAYRMFGPKASGDNVPQAMKDAYMKGSAGGKGSPGGMRGGSPGGMSGSPGGMPGGSPGGPGR